MSSAPRDLMGYGRRPPRVDWPGSSRLAVCLSLNYEEGSELSISFGDERREMRSEFDYGLSPSERDLFQESNYEYGSRVGHWRILDLFEEYEIQCTVNAVGMALEANPAMAEFLRSSHHDIVGHGQRWVPSAAMDCDTERATVREALATIEETTGRSVRGWFSRPAISTNTRTILAEEGLFYDANSIADDLPYYTDVRGRPFLVVPYGLDTNDSGYWKERFVTADDFFRYLRDAFDWLYLESRRTPRMLSIGIHGRISGRPSRMQALRRFCDYIMTKRAVWIAGRTQIAEVWARQFAPDGAWNWPSQADC